MDTEKMFSSDTNPNDFWAILQEMQVWATENKKTATFQLFGIDIVVDTNADLFAIANEYEESRTGIL
jgi:hypothetical protein